MTGLLLSGLTTTRTPRLRSTRHRRRHRPREALRFWTTGRLALRSTRVALSFSGTPKARGESTLLHGTRREAGSSFSGIESKFNTARAPTASTSIERSASFRTNPLFFFMLSTRRRFSSREPPRKRMRLMLRFTLGLSASRVPRLVSWRAPCLRRALERRAASQTRRPLLRCSRRHAPERGASCRAP
eukprot:Amastigsp_a841637_477.p2 type:complete len:187 gc:universal Amastigsp_a841637_477:240-800(+)